MSLKSLLEWYRGVRKKYEFSPVYHPITTLETARQCSVHPLNPATHWELNDADKSYRRPVCEGCTA
jgi:hypothetical protein